MTAVCAPVLIAALLWGGWLRFQDGALPWQNNPGGLSGVPAVQNKYYDAAGRRLFTVYPEPQAEAGKKAGYMFHFDEPFAAYAGKTLTLQAVHPATGAKEALSSEVIAQPSSGYASLERYTARFVLPLAGLWDLNVLLDGKLYGQVRLSMNEPSWDITPEFRSGAYMMRGIESEVGFIDAGFVAGKGQKYMWHFWGDDALLNGPFVLKAVKQGSDELIDVFGSAQWSSANALSGKLNGADRTAVTTMTLPEAGRWRLLPYVQGRLLDTIVVEVSE
ncbi:DUF4871 domain-containing protein [Cohnella sp. 56]|uniref:DUF4871 domain-containing protein n=1 Tax=Cohnella sp. 56 TaxID=3113722 RepID=UPI0030EAD697